MKKWDKKRDSLHLALPPVSSQCSYLSNPTYLSSLIDNFDTWFIFFFSNLSQPSLEMVHLILWTLSWSSLRSFTTSPVQFSRLNVSDFLRPHGLQHARLPWSSPTPTDCSNWCPLNRSCHPTISSSVIPFFSCLPSFPVSGSFSMSQFFVSGGQSIAVSTSASVLLMNIQDWFPWGLTSLISLYSKGLSSLLHHHSSKASILWCSAFFMVQLSYPNMITRKTIALTR